MGAMNWQPKRVVQRVVWEARRLIWLFVWRFGWIGVLVLACTLVSVAAGVIIELQAITLSQMRSIATSSSSPPVLEHVSADISPNKIGERLQAFDEYLLPHDEIPDALKNLFALAEDSGLMLARGEYKAQVEQQGWFVRYGMTLPVNGNPQTIHMFILNALAKNRTLALDSIQFKRERVDSNEIEARLQWVLFTRLPSYPRSGFRSETNAVTSGAMASKEFE